MYIGWGNHVNKVILDSTTVSVGNGAFVEDSIETGGIKKRRMINANPVDKYKVKMAFDFVEKDANGYTELERFYAWYKYTHKYGTNPFKFPAILINSNRQSGFSTEDTNYIAQRIINGDTSAKMPDNEYYVITSALEGAKSGHSLEIDMDWESYPTSVFTVPEGQSEVDHIEAENGWVDVILTSEPASEPIETTFDVYCSKDGGTETQETITASIYDGIVTVRLYFEEKDVAGIYTIRVEDKTSSFEVV